MHARRDSPRSSLAPTGPAEGDSALADERHRDPFA